ncbi:uncharacterized protein LOC123989241 [Osmia bicornis bicornis]|uniref:uncharacterized protein LOC123989241 n=1 Tax=Osmia bicornis bicornis TaxID=1437191 RepID=UPI001EAF7D6F|nr:uncharacterized protein LOC123989241 [Osmia bicornis bicornis]
MALLAASSAFSFPTIPLCAGTHTKITGVLFLSTGPFKDSSTFNTLAESLYTISLLTSPDCLYHLRASANAIASAVKIVAPGFTLRVFSTQLGRSSEPAPVRPSFPRLSSRSRVQGRSSAPRPVHPSQTSPSP